jgi:membrane protease YdiL (CAAX protease family)
MTTAALREHDADPPAPVRETAWFVALSLPALWGLAAWHARGHEISSYVFQAVPALCGMGCAWAFRREPPRAAGFEHTGWTPWLAGVLGPFAALLSAVGLAYLLRALWGRPEILRFQPELMAMGELHGGEVAWLLLPELLWPLLIGLAIAWVYRAGWPDRLQAALPGRRRWLHHGFRALVWSSAAWNPALVLTLGEELGWRGYLARRWAHRPPLAALLSASCWVAYAGALAVFTPETRAHVLDSVVGLVSLLAQGVISAALYLWSRSIWPSTAYHLGIYVSMVVMIGDRYYQAVGLFGGMVADVPTLSLANTLVNVAIAAVLLGRWRR